jgi:hypothetical protein
LAGFDVKSVNPLDWAIVGAGALTFLLSLFGFYSASYSINVAGYKNSASQSASAWHAIIGGGFFGWFAMVLAVAGAAVLVVSLVLPSALTILPVPPRLAVLGLFAAAFVCELLAVVIHPAFGSYHDAGSSSSVGHGFTFWLSLLVILAGAVMSFLRIRQNGDSLPWERNVAR